MKKLLTLGFSAFAFITTFAQAQNPVTWQAKYKAISATEGEIIVFASIESGWHTYSQKPTDAGPISTTFTFVTAKGAQLIGKTEENGAHEEFDKAFDAKLFIFYEKAEFSQKIKITGKGPISIPIKVEYTCCNDRMCLPPKVIDLTVKVQ